MKRILITTLITIVSILAYCQSNVPVAFDYRCSDRNSETFLRAVISTFGMDTVKMWIDDGYGFSCTIKIDSLGYVKKHLELTMSYETFGEYRRKKLERYLIRNKVRFEICCQADDENDINTSVSAMPQNIKLKYERYGYLWIRGYFPKGLRNPYVKEDESVYEKLSPFEKFCKRLNIKFEE